MRAIATPIRDISIINLLRLVVEWTHRIIAATDVAHPIIALIILELLIVLLYRSLHRVPLLLARVGRDHDVRVVVLGRVLMLRRPRTISNVLGLRKIDSARDGRYPLFQVYLLPLEHRGVSFLAVIVIVVMLLLPLSLQLELLHLEMLLEHVLADVARIQRGIIRLGYLVPHHPGSTALVYR